jgi:pyruvate kinase
MNNLDEVIEASDAIMIDRGDLSVETNLQTIALFQKQILKVAQLHGKPVIVATEMLHSMIENPFPTKAEVSDISNAVLDGASALMLSGETAVGKYPAQAVALMRLVVDTVGESAQAAADSEHEMGVPQAMGQAIAMLCRRLPITKIVAVTISGYAARMVANSRPRQPILAVSNDAATARGLNLLFGTEGIHVDIPFSRTSTDHVAVCLEELWRRGKLSDDDTVLVVSVGYPRSGNRMNMVQTHSVSYLRESLGWKK